MSRWRKIASEAVPMCKLVIETAETPAQMWIALYDELTHFDESGRVISTDAATASRIHDFALRCFQSKTPKFLCADVWIFFHYLVGGYLGSAERTQNDLGK